MKGPCFYMRADGFVVVTWDSEIGL